MASPVTPPPGVLELLGGSSSRPEPLDPRGHPWLLLTDDGQAVLRRSTTTIEHVAWLHRFLAQLAASGFPAPRLLRLLRGASLAVVDGAVWETVSFLPGRPLGWDPAVPLASADALLARFHQASLAISPPEQRPQALPVENCRPACEQGLSDPSSTSWRLSRTTRPSAVSCTATRRRPTCWSVANHYWSVP
jgi:Phosphotransferase enzyme family